MAQNPYLDQYRKSAVAGASPIQLVVMLYDGCLRFMTAGQKAMVDKELFKQNESLQKAQKILAELMSTLDMDRGGEVATNLFSLYTFCYNRLVEANIEDKPEYIDQAIQVMSNLRESWVELDAQQKRGANAESAAA